MSLQSYPPPGGTFICGICGLPGEKRSRQQKYHSGECKRKAQARRDGSLDRKYRAEHGVQARRARRNA